ncbi:response regulator [Kordiimonas marina]|uniref:response regulator n=1 Tax=Kordiimonas marina TaxID=2872312 RepID=UPI001FF44524|nr:response regulator [Kordiimonas marina]MCJ9428463.1 response regulator [Kordiimonas marina]
MPAISLGSLHVMVAMSSQQVAEGLRDILIMQRVGRVFVPADNREAVAEMQSRGFNLIIIEQDFPELGGVDFCRFLRLTSGPASVAPIIFGIPAPDRAKVLAARDAGATKIVAVPFTGASLMKAVQDAVSDPRPIIQTSSYNGPDRRQRVDPSFRGPERRQKMPDMITPTLRTKILNGVE